MRKLSLFLAFTLCLLCCQPILAAGGSLTLSPGYYDSLNDALVISGVVNDEIGNIPMTLKVEAPDGKLWGMEETTAMEKNGAVTFTFPAVYFGAAAASGAYTITVGSMYTAVVTAIYNYSGADLMLSAMQNVNKAISGEITIASALSNSVLAVDTQGYNALGTKAKGQFDTLLKTKTYTLPADVLTEANAAEVKKQIKQFRTDFDEIMSICKFINIQSSADLASWLTAYKASYALDTDDTATSGIDESKIYGYLDHVSASAKLLARITGLTKLPNSTADLKAQLYEMALLTNIEVRGTAVVKKIFEDFAALFPTTKGQYDAAYTTVTGKHYATYADAAKAYDNAVPDTPGQIVSPGPNNSTNWGTASGSGSGQYTPAAETSRLPFGDLDSVSWAQEAIKKLYEKRVISGTDTGDFLPNHNVKRCEFLKMILLARNISIRTDISSKMLDISADSWYADYVATAEALGIITGDTDGCFRPDSYITRQDMVVMLSRAGGISEGGSVTFADEAGIADYAKAAVSYYAEKGVVSGMGDNRFEPQQLSTRAQAAQLIYNAIQ